MGELVALPSGMKQCTCPNVRHKHGTAASYGRCGCRCTSCRRAVAKQKRDLKTRRYLARGPLKVNSIGSVRRIQALSCIGYSQQAQSEYLGIHLQSVNRILRRNQKTVHVWLAENIRRMYDDLSMKPLSIGKRALYARAVARKNGWVPPLAWDELTIDDPNGRPDLGESRKEDWFAEVEFLVSCGESEEQALKTVGRSRVALEKARERRAA